MTATEEWGPLGTNVGVVYETSTGTVRRVIVPTFEIEVYLHALADDESIMLVPKADYGISGDVATLPQIASIVKGVEPAQ